MSQLHVLKPRLPVGDVSGPQPLLQGIVVASQLVILSTIPAGHAGMPPSGTAAPELEPELELEDPVPPELLLVLGGGVDPELELEELEPPAPLEELLLDPVPPPLELLELPPPPLELEELEPPELDPPLLLELEKPGFPPVGVLLQAEPTVPPTSTVAAHTYTYEETRIASPCRLARRGRRDSPPRRFAGRTRMSKRGGLMRRDLGRGPTTSRRDAQETNPE